MGTLLRLSVGVDGELARLAPRARRLGTDCRGLATSGCGGEGSSVTLLAMLESLRMTRMTRIYPSRGEKKGDSLQSCSVRQLLPPWPVLKGRIGLPGKELTSQESFFLPLLLRGHVDRPHLPGLHAGRAVAAA